MGKTTELLTLLKTGNSDAARKLITKLKKSGKKKAQSKELNTPDDNGQTVIHYCAANNFIEFIQDLIELGAAIDIADDKGYTPLHIASGAGRTSAVTALLSRGADPNIVSRGGDTPLHLACQNGHAPAVEALVSEGANCTMLNVSGHTPLDLACQNGHAQVVGLLLRSGQFSQAYLQRSDMPHTALLLAAKQGNNEVIGLLVKHGFDVNRRLPGSQGTSLHEAALYGKVDTVLYLLQCGADVAAVNAQGLTALDIVNMYTDPRSAGMMKQVLQDALAQQARVRIAQQHQAQPQHQPHQHQPHQPQQHAHQQQARQHQAHHTPPASSRAHHQQPAGFNYLQLGSQQAPTRQGSVSEHQPHGHQTPPTPKQQPVGFNYLQLGAQQPRPQRQGSVGEGGHLEQRAHTYGGQQLTQHGYQQQESHQRQQQQSYPQPQTGEYHRQPSHEATVTTQSTPGVTLGGAPDLAAMIAAKAASRKPMLGSPTKKDFPADDDRFIRSATLTYGERMADMRQTALHRRGSHSDRSSTSPDQDHHNPPTLPRRTHMGPPQFKPVPPPAEGDFRLTARPEHRLSGRSSHSDRSPSPDSLQQRGSQSSHGGGPPSNTLQELAQLPRLKKAKVQPKARPPASSSSVDDELMKKLLHRQNRMQQVKQNLESEEGGSEQPAEEVPQQDQQQAVEEPPCSQPKPSRPPPIPERKTAILSTQGSVLAETEKPPHSEKPTQVEKTVEAPAPQPKPRPKPPPPKPKEPSSGLSPWQEELLKRKQRMAQYEDEAQVESQEAENQGEPQDPPPALEVEHLSSLVTPPSQLPVKELLQEPQVKEPPREPVREPPWEAVRKPPLEPVKESPREPVREPPRAAVRKPPREPMIEPPLEPVKEPPWEPVREPPRAAVRKPPREPVIEPPREPGKEPPWEPVREPPREPPQEPPSEPIREPLREPPLAPVLREPLPEPPASGLKSVEEPESNKKPPDELRIKPLDSLIGAPSTPTSDQLSRSTSLSSLATTTGTVSPTQGSLEPLPIVEWLTAYKLQEYVPLFEAQGYDTTEFLAGITQEELSELGVQKIGHRKKILTALSTMPSRENFLGGTKPSNVPVLLQLLSLPQYEAVLLEAGYDDIDFITDITAEELLDVGISKKAHLRRFIKGIAELGEVLKTVIPAFSPIPPPPSFNGTTAFPRVPFSEQPLPGVPVETSLGLSENPSLEGLPSVQLSEPLFEPYHDEAGSRPRQDSTGQNAYSANSVLKSESSSSFSRMKNVLETQMGLSGSRESLSHGEESESSEAAMPKFDSRSPSASPQVQRKAANRPGAPPPPKRSTSTALSSIDSLGLSRHSLSDSSTSLSSAERMGVEIPPPAGAQQVDVQQSPPKIPPKLSRKPPKAPRAIKPQEVTDSGVRVEGYSVTETHSVHIEEVHAHSMESVQRVGEDEPSGDALDQLSRALEGFEPETGQTNKGRQPEPEEDADQLLADIDDMLADLNTHLDFMIPGSS